MILEQLEMCDFRVINGKETVDLTPRMRNGRKRPIILFGGLNGAGKTTTLTAIRLALYGRHSLGSNVSNKEYHAYLQESIHRSRNSLVQANSARIHLTFSYATRGEVSRYTVKREWTVSGASDKVNETLRIEKDGTLLKELSYDQCQGFLKELVPIGVSDLFFFDGEKIAELAEDKTGRALGSAIRKLLGLDVITRMRDDLAIYLREKNTAAMPEEHQQQIADLKSEYEIAYASYKEALDAHSESVRQIGGIDSDIKKSEGYISSKGGEWARSRSDEKERVNELLVEKKNLEAQIRECMASGFPLVLAFGKVEELLTQLEKEQDYKKQQLLKVTLNKKINVLKKSLEKSLKDKDAVDVAITQAFSDVFAEIKQINVVHDCSEREFSRINHLVKEVLPAARTQMLELGDNLAAVQQQLDNASKNLERAPDEAFLQDELEHLRTLNEQRSNETGKGAIAKEEARKALREAMDLMRKMQKKEQEFSSNFSSNRAYQMARSSRELLNEFAAKTTVNKVKQLEQEFVRSFRKLARKDDISLEARIDPKNFDVRLLNKNGEEINKQQLSAGEKQIFAIAILEALAKTSGRKLPIIIDTPLGRLDSKHRGKLVENYFPTASHQVVILSTDTEIDQAYFKTLSPHISHVYEVEYFPDDGHSEFMERRYFGQKLEEEAVVEEFTPDVA
ncbi:DNA sulfur modification protein DndD [Parendozoicomonas sp. Alg238-R29]|uniref:DNA sulfur modification protein DndD n=1 Tax=Parendozoicomonas sp. Alg238-R29 TaxID=2993446 RepID=UPI00248D5E27|nr:DNA sulfur modification protein DndD [Parendozoicomonas sp. Alg238-R29]